MKSYWEHSKATSFWEGAAICFFMSFFVYGIIAFGRDVLDLIMWLIDKAQACGG